TVSVTATTGIAAVELSGTTLHSFCGIGLENGTVKELIEKVESYYPNILLSTLDGELFDKLEEIARSVHKDNRPFGGILLIIAGDFFQLPPIRNDKFCYEANSWHKCFKHTIQLSVVLRQKEPEFINMLNEIRIGLVTEKTLNIMEMLKQPCEYFDEIQPTKLYPKNYNVAKTNLEYLSKIQNKSYYFYSEDQDYGQLDTLIKNCLAPKKLELKCGAQVMLIKNINKNLVNGSRGIVVGFFSVDKKQSYYNGKDEGINLHQDVILPIVKFTENIEINVHMAEWQLETIGPAGQTYVALSRAKSMKSLEVLNFSRDKVMVDEKVKRFYDNLQVFSENMSIINNKRKRTLLLQAQSKQLRAEAKKLQAKAKGLKAKSKMLEAKAEEIPIIN
ncbi:8504_t:CDS:2, partial [Entrophospora sp. SA101]